MDLRRGSCGSSGAAGWPACRAGVARACLRGRSNRVCSRNSWRAMFERVGPHRTFFTMVAHTCQQPSVRSAPAPALAPCPVLDNLHPEKWVLGWSTFSSMQGQNVHNIFKCGMSLKLVHFVLGLRYFIEEHTILV